MTDRDKVLEDALRAVYALREITQWCDAYPVDVFPELSDEDYARAHTALVGVGLSSDRLHAAWARHLLTGITKLAKDALE